MINMCSHIYFITVLCYFNKSDINWVKYSVVVDNNSIGYERIICLNRKSFHKSVLSIIHVNKVQKYYVIYNVQEKAVSFGLCK